MASTIKVNNIQNQCGANIINESANTITIGASGDTIQLACGASQTGFGRTGTVDWDTTAKTTSFTAVSGNGYFVNTTSGAVTVTLPATPSSGDIVSVSDYNGTAGTNAITIARNSSNINGSALDYEITKEYSAVTFVYVDGTVGWTSVQTANTLDNVNPFIVATGGTETTCGNFKIHTFTSPGTFTVTNAGTGAGSNTVDYLVVAGGGGGGNHQAGGGGGGGFRESPGAASGSYSVSPLGTAPAIALPVPATAYPITVGGGGAGDATPGGANGTSGSNSIFSTITSTGGGGGGYYLNNPSGGVGLAGGSGGGGGSSSSENSLGAKASGNTPPVSPPQGQPGGSAWLNAPHGAGGGGGATEAGQDRQPPGVGGRGGAGATTSISGSALAYSGGGGGSGCSGGNGAGSPCGTGGRGDSPPAPGAVAGTTNRGGGGGGSFSSAGSPQGANGGSGIVIIRYKYQ